MARIIQIRRGNTAQNDEFTGMPGEITMDTDAKTIRVHDGEKQGGYILRRADQDEATFDINSVPDEFWRELFVRFGRGPAYGDTAMGNLTMAESGALPLLKCDGFKHTFTGLTQAAFIRVVLICMDDDAGYVAGDECTSFGIGDACVPMTHATPVPQGLDVLVFFDYKDVWVPNKETCAKTVIDTNKWRMKIRVYY